MAKRRIRKRGQLGQIVNGTAYKDTTDPRVVDILESARGGPLVTGWRETQLSRGERICIRYGDQETGRDWGDQDMCGTVSRSQGTPGLDYTNKLPLLIKSKRSTGGQPIHDDVIVKITRGAKPKQKHGQKYVLFEHPKYHHPAGDIEAIERIAKDVDAEARMAARAGDKAKAAELKLKARAIRNQRYDFTGRKRR